MSRPNFITNENIIEWSQQINEELPSEMSDDPLLREVCLAGKWLVSELSKLECTDDISARIQYTAAKNSFGREPWAVHQQFLQGYKNNELIFESDPDSSDLN